MKWLGASWFYPVASLAVASIAGIIDGQRGMMGSLAAWALCGVPILIERLAVKAHLRKTSLNRGLIIAPPGMFLRFAWTLGGAAILWQKVGDQLGWVFWPAVLVFYQLALAAQVRRALDRTDLH